MFELKLKRFAKLVKLDLDNFQTVTLLGAKLQLYITLKKLRYRGAG